MHLTLDDQHQCIDHRYYNFRFSHNQVNDTVLFRVCHNGFWCKLVLLKVHLCHLSPSENIIVENLIVFVIYLIYMLLIFSLQTLYTYPENFRAYKALIAAQYSGCNVKVDPGFVFGETNKTDAFLKKFPLGKVI